MGIAIITAKWSCWEVSVERATMKWWKIDKYQISLGIKYCSSFKTNAQCTMKEIPIITSNYKEV